jgi:hypothetical protein
VSAATALRRYIYRYFAAPDDISTDMDPWGIRIQACSLHCLGPRDCDHPGLSATVLPSPRSPPTHDIQKHKVTKIIKLLRMFRDVLDATAGVPGRVITQKYLANTALQHFPIRPDSRIAASPYVVLRNSL